MLKIHPLLLAQIICHISIAPMVLLADVSNWLFSLIVYFFTGCVGMSMTYHRFLSHRSWKAPRWLEVFGTLCATIGLTGSSLAWCSVHREHHKRSDTIKDPHSPWFQKWWRVQFLSMLHKPKISFMKDKLKDPFHRFIHKNYFPINFLYGMGCFLMDPFAVIYAYLFPAAFLWNAGSAVNTVGHLCGYRNFYCKDKSKNNPLLAFITWGEGWHNNHHQRPSKFYFGIKWYELDIAGAVIWLLCFAGRGK